MPTDETVIQFSERSPGQPEVRGFLHQPAGPSTDAVILTHGAGSNCKSPLLVSLCEVFASNGFLALRCDLPFRQAHPHGPPRGSSAEDQAGLRRAVELMRSRVEGRVLLGGHSYGGRQASMLAARERDLAEGLLLLSYPLHPPRKPGELRTKHLADLRTPVLFVHGSRDPFGSLEELEEAMKLIPAQTRLLKVEEAGHDLKPGRSRQPDPGEELSQKIVKAVLELVGQE